MFREWTESMTMHGFPNIFRTKYISIRIMWIIFFFTSNGCCFFIISRILVDYFKYDVVTTIKVIEKDSMPFPAVTVCNTNSFVTEEAFNYVTSFLTKNNLTAFPNVNLGESFNGNFSKLYYTYNFIRFLTASNSKENKQEILKSFSLPFEKMFVSCLYNLQPCDQDVWEWYYDYYYGNCFRFNTGKNSKGENTQIKHTNREGKSYGLMIELFVGSQKTLSYSNGAHIFVDD
ncbi:amiloride-sensitive sodium channel subunit gamma-like isoform X4, partial [Brachionus plicatilis]